ncbi:MULTISPECIES: hypothetical protein [Staphylococcus]|uniref:hypothetical protein n=1 Tax=Staphylococcus TaxID=1279 RepID=UPI0001EF49DC|nr:MULTISPECIES: hypothetical protein [Staphylococcus]EFS18102.1 conserved domain protein [Staphylococcus capitis C87]MBC3049904.1 hypothetical protein [Staphylococcus capitis]MBC3069862.1 hypothetical protein [Staphylococcus capitis]MBC3072044.1 hypothetical protein [Staphylococcus capitis]MBC3082973.1 hypothetical protein [Staphylococcus capitis]
MTILWLVILVVLAILNKYIVQKLLSQDKVLHARICATITSVCACLLVYLFIKSLMPHVIDLMNVFYHH